MAEFGWIAVKADLKKEENMMRNLKIRKTLCAAVFLMLTAARAYAGSNLIENPGFDFKEWKQHWIESSPLMTGVWKSASEQFSSPNSALFTALNLIKERTVTLSQDFAASSGLPYTAGAYIKSLSDSFPVCGGAYAYVGLGWYGVSGKIGDIELSDCLTDANNMWSWYSVSDAAPAGTTCGRIYLSLYSPGMSLPLIKTAYFDSASVTVAPEPIATILFLGGGALMGGRLLSRKKKEIYV